MSRSSRRARSGVVEPRAGASLERARRSTRGGRGPLLAASVVRPAHWKGPGRRASPSRAMAEVSSLPPAMVQVVADDPPRLEVPDPMNDRA